MSGQLTITQLEQKAEHIREDIIRMLEAAGSGHSAGPLGLADIFAALYFNIMNFDPKNPDWEDRDIFSLAMAMLCLCSMLLWQKQDILIKKSY